MIGYLHFYNFDYRMRSPFPMYKPYTRPDLHISKAFTLQQTIQKIKTILDTHCVRGFKESVIQSFAQIAMNKGSVKIIISDGL